METFRLVWELFSSSASAQRIVNAYLDVGQVGQQEHKTRKGEQCVDHLRLASKTKATRLSISLSSSLIYHDM